ncbi:mechanosensitive ion channel family protein [Natronobiforma cellulositropha]|uniref:mechanosensitive ion channel family protein n=1 Tax=Natronobiforma cellulositropha TaxID=1679076 RepID=UPI0021D60FB8|nr:mechanosensitive ion channel family protein [Natronobiforma cellulositropha]
MFETLTRLDWLSEQVTTVNGRLAVTVAVAGLLLVVLLTSQPRGRWLNERIRPLYADIVSTLVLVGTVALTVSVTVGVWGQAGEVQRRASAHDLESAVIARAVLSFVVLLSAYIVARFVHRLLREVLASASAVTDHQREITYRLTQVTIWGLALIVVLGVWIDDLSGLLVGAGFLGIVLGMAARQTLGAMLAGFVLMFDRPFEIGDWIEIDDQEGIVTDISIVNTRIRSFDGEYVMVPNDVVGSQMVTNRTKQGRLRVEVEVGVDYESDLERASDLAREAVEQLEESIDAPAPQVVTKEFGDSAIVLGVRFWIDRPSASRRWRAQTAAIGAIKATFDEHGITIPYPQRELSSRDDADGVSVAMDERALEGGGRESGDETEEPTPSSADSE